MTVAHVSERLKAEVDAMTEFVDQIPELSRLPDPLTRTAALNRDRWSTQLLRPISALWSPCCLSSIQTAPGEDCPERSRRKG